MSLWTVVFAVVYAGASTATALSVADAHWRAKGQLESPPWMFVLAGLLWPLTMAVVLAGAVRVAWHVRKLRKMK